jgi:hypothetical protein
MVLPKNLRISETAVTRNLDGESVILNIDSGIYFGLDEVGTRVWQLIEEVGDVESILRVLQDEYDEAPDVIRADVEGLLALLIDKRLVTSGGPESA